MKSAIAELDYECLADEPRQDEIRWVPLEARIVELARRVELGKPLFPNDEEQP